MDSLTLSVQDRWIDTPRGRLLARIWQPAGADPALAPVLLFHDSLGCVELWRSFPEALALSSGRRVVAYDRPGFGQSAPRTDRLDSGFVGEEAEHVLPLLRQQLKIDRFVAFGHSVGGGMAVHCAARAPDACEALVTESAQAFVEDRTRAGIMQARELFRQPGQFERLQRYHGDKARWVLSAWIDTWLSPEFAGWSLAPVLGQVRCPALVLHGSEDEYGSQQHPLAIARGVAGPVELQIMPAVRHVPHREQEAVVAARVTAFLATLTAAPGPSRS
ncbi:alpha/beta hydrolase [Massilia solisilvae]|uniref:Alpha/beta hydrolase n=1 Tax=Massilia solisilvae TaxID=1811225 RepID=A0ABT2BIV4_9BURK|nr:alpha/beta hydrolase [Massilia solisilvae]MCS0608439.1 alpha/beta hydrolase [Massilia solisilvae]